MKEASKSATATSGSLPEPVPLDKKKEKDSAETTSAQTMPQSQRYSPIMAPRSPSRLRHLASSPPGQLSDQRSILLQSQDGIQFFTPSDAVEEYVPAGGDLDLESLSTPKQNRNQEDPIASESLIFEGNEKVENELQTEGQSKPEEAKQPEKRSEFQLSYTALKQLNSLREQKTERIVDYIESQLKDLQDTHKKQVKAMMATNEEKMSSVRRRTRDIKKLTEHNNLLDSQLASLYNENVSLREKISQLEDAITRGPENAAVTVVLKDIKDKLWGDTLKISPEKRKRIVLLKKLSQTRFKPTNEKHCALLNRLWSLHSEDPEPTWTDLGFETNNPGEELGKTGILGLQNLVYFSERYTALAKARSRTELYKWALAGISITALLTSLLHLHGDKGFFSAFAPPSGIFKTFTNLMNHSKAFEELYCVCFMIYDNIINTERNVNELERTKQKLQDLLLTNPHDLQELIQNAKCL